MLLKAATVLRSARPPHHPTWVTSGARSDHALRPRRPFGIAALGLGPLVDHGTSLSTLYGCTAAAAMDLLFFAVLARRRSPPRLHPRPATADGQEASSR
jgi:hypothetical protein